MSLVSRRFTTLAMASLIAPVGILGITPVSAAGRLAAVEVPADVVTDGLNVEQLQQRQVELSAALLRELPALASLEQVRVAIGAEEMAAIDQVDRATSPLPIGIVKRMSQGINVFGLEKGVIKGKDGGVVWASVITVERAGAIRLHIENFNLPEGAEMYVYSRAGEAYGPYRGTGPDFTGAFWTTSVFGTEVIVQIRLSGPDVMATLPGASMRINEVGVLSQNFTGPDLQAPLAFCGNASCIVDATCYSAANSIKDAYAKMEWISGPFLYTCTGGLLNDANPSATNYFLTANHCLSKTATAKNVSFYWRFRTSTCNGACPSNSGWPYKTTGSAVASTNRGGDYTLLTLNTAPPAGSVRLGFTNVAVANSNGVALHRVSNPGFGPQVYNEQTVSTSAPQCQGWPRGERIYSRDTLGATDGGSSGSPVVNSADQVVGQLSGGCGTNVNNVCDAVNNATVDGALAYYWTSVQPFLAP